MRFVKGRSLRILPPMFGSHLSIAGGMHNALLTAEKLRMETVQVFTKNQQQWAAKPLDPSAIAEFRKHADRLQFRRIVSHASYLINLAATDDTLWRKSIDAFVDEMQRCDQLGIESLVIHPGAHCGSGEECGVGRVAEALNLVLDKEKDGKVTVCLETTAGQGSCLGCRFEQLAEMRRKIDRRDRVGICVDTCHILAAGYDITTATGTRNVLDELDRVVGLQHVKAWHLNDSRKPLGSRVDRHEHIGRGCVGVEAFAVICQDQRFNGIPKILETPKDPAPDGRDWDEVNLELLRGLAEGRDIKPKQFAATSEEASAPKKPAKTRTKAAKK